MIILLVIPLESTVKVFLKGSEQAYLAGHTKELASSWHINVGFIYLH